MKNRIYEAKMLPQADIQVKVLEEIPLLQLLEEMKISREKRKTLKVMRGKEEIVNFGTILQPEDVLILHFQPEARDKELSFEPVDIVYEDEYCLVADKPPFLLVHTDGNDKDTLSARVNGYLIQEGWPYPAQPVHRIDYEAQGLVLFCKHPLLQAYFDEQISKNHAKKEYLAVIDGKMAKKHIDLNNPIARDRHDARKMIVFKSGKPSHTHIENLKTIRNQSLVKATIDTGRRHQIRVHLAHNGHPIVNDSLYGKGSAKKPLLLQANRLVFKQPFTEEEIEVQADFPASFVPFTKRDIEK